MITNRKLLPIMAGAALTGLASGGAQADTATLDFFAPGVSGAVTLTLDPTKTDSNFPNAGLGNTETALEVQGISGTFSDTNNGLGIVDANVTGLVGISPTATLDTDPPNTNAPHDFSIFKPIQNPFGVLSDENLYPGESYYMLSYDNLYWPGGAPTTAWVGYPFGGGPLDVYGLMFTVEGGYTVNLWSNTDSAIGYVVLLGKDNGNTIAVDAGSAPEPSTWAMMALGFAGLGFAGYRNSRARSASTAA
jgi:hypothetical protein